MMTRLLILTNSLISMWIVTMICTKAISSVLNSTITPDYTYPIGNASKGNLSIDSSSAYTTRFIATSWTAKTTQTTSSAGYPVSSQQKSSPAGSSGGSSGGSTAGTVFGVSSTVVVVVVTICCCCICYHCCECCKKCLCEHCRNQTDDPPQAPPPQQQQQPRISPNPLMNVGQQTVPFYPLANSNWSYDKYFSRLLSPSDPEYNQVIHHISMNDGLAWIGGIISICRIENRTLSNLYMTARQNMHGQNPHWVNNERVLYHGTRQQVLNNICSDGFNRTYRGRNATAYGEGTYFARNFSYSADDTYSPRDERGTKYVFQCLVLTGYYELGQQGMLEPPMRRDKPIKYDSTVDRIQYPSVFVIFRDNHAYPLYLISFR